MCARLLAHRARPGTRAPRRRTRLFPQFKRVANSHHDPTPRRSRPPTVDESELWPRGGRCPRSPAVSARESLSAASPRAESRRPVRRSPSPPSPLALDGEGAVFDKGPDYPPSVYGERLTGELLSWGPRVSHDQRLRLPTLWGASWGVTWLEPRAGREPRVPSRPASTWIVKNSIGRGRAART